MQVLKNLSILAAAALISSAVIAAPQGFGSGSVGGPQGFNNAAPNSVAGVLSSGHDDQVVTLRGRLTNYLGDDRYEFTDAKGDRIEIELDDDQNWSNIRKDQLIEITGEIDKDLMSTTIDVKRAVPIER